MISKNTSLFFIAFIALLGLSGCARYKAQPLNRLATGLGQNSKEQTISFAYRVFSQSDCKKYLDRDVLAKGYQPIHITLSNNTNRYLYVSTTGFSLPCVMAEEVAQKVHTSTSKRAVSYGVAGLFIWPFLIPAVVDGVGSSQANQQLDLDFGQKTIRDQTVSPYSTINGLIFVPCAYFHEDFTFTVIDSENQERFVLTPGKPRLTV